MDYLPQLLQSDPKTISAAVIAVIVGLTVLKKSIGNGSDDVGKTRKPPGADWLWGHEKEAWATFDSEWYIRNAEEYGLMLAMKGALFHDDILAVADPGALHHMYSKNTYNYGKSTVTGPLIDRLVGRGLLWANGDDHRQLIAPLFTHPHIRLANDVIHTLSERFIDKMRASLSEPSVVDVLPWISRGTLDMIGMFGFGHDFGCGESPESHIIHQSWKQQVQLGMTSTGFAAPLVLRAFPWITHFLSDLLIAQGKVKLLVRDISKRMIAERHRVLDIVGRESFDGDILHALIKTTNMDDEKAVTEMLDQITTLVITGHETSTNAIGFILLELARQPVLQEALRQEILQAGRPTYDEIMGSTKLPLLDAVVKEGLRVRPIGSHTERVAGADDVIPLRHPVKTTSGETMNSIRVKKGQVFYIPAVAINTNVHMWGPDGHVFDPYRWLEPGRVAATSELTGGINGHFAFTEGTRICAGHRFAVFEIKVALSDLIKNFQFAESKDHPVRTIYSATLQPFVVGKQEAGAQLPLLVTPLDHA